MGAFVQENKRAVIALAVAVGVALVVVVVMLVTGGSSEPEAAPVPRATPTATPMQTPDVEQTQQAGSFAPDANASRTDPFAPLPGSDPTTATQQTKADKSGARTKSTKSASSSDTGSTGDASSKGSFADPAPVPSSDSGTDSPADRKPADPVAPQPVGPGGAAGDGLQVKVMTVTPDSVSARINGQKVTLYVAVPDASGVTYVSPLEGACAWLAAGTDASRVTVCEGETVTL